MQPVIILSADLYAREADACKANGELQAAENLNNCSVAFLQAGKAEAAYQAVADTPQFSKNAGDIRRQAMALGNRAAALEGCVVWRKLYMIINTQPNF